MLCASRRPRTWWPTFRLGTSPAQTSWCKRSLTSSPLKYVDSTPDAASAPLPLGALNLSAPRRATPGRRPTEEPRKRWPPCTPVSSPKRSTPPHNAPPVRALHRANVLLGEVCQGRRPFVQNPALRTCTLLTRCNVGVGWICERPKPKPASSPAPQQSQPKLSQFFRGSTRR